VSTEDRQPSEEELRAALEEEMRRVTVDDVLLQAAVSLVNLGGRKAGLAPGTEGERDPAQVQTAVDAVSALLPILEAHGREEVKPIRDALAQLQLAYTKLAGAGAASGESPPPEPGGAPPAPGEAEPAKDQPDSPPSSGRLWVPGQ
jgi:hypothetical protein